MNRLIAIFFLVFLNSSPLHGSGGKDVLVIHSWHDILWDRLWSMGLENTLPEGQYNLRHIYLDTLRVSPEQLEINAQTALEDIDSSRPEVVILGDDVALKLLGPKLRDTDQNVVFLGINHHPNAYLDGNISAIKNMTGVLERPLYKRALVQLSKLWPKRINRIMLLNEFPLEQAGSVTDLSSVFRGAKSVKIGSVVLDIHVIQNWEEWQQKVRMAEELGYDAITYDSRYLLRDANGTYKEPEADVIAWTQANSPVPLFAFYEDSIGPNLATGGFVISARNQGRLAAGMVRKIVEEQVAPGDITIHFDDQHFWIFSATQLARWGLPLKDDLRKLAYFVEEEHDLYQF